VRKGKRAIPRFFKVRWRRLGVGDRLRNAADAPCLWYLFGYAEMAREGWVFEKFYFGLKFIRTKPRESARL